MTNDLAITIRHATVADIPVLIQLSQQSETAAHWSEQQYQDFFSQNQRRMLLLAESTAPGAVGFIVAHRIAPEWELENIVVAAGVQRKGVGRSLLRALIKHGVHTNSDAVFLEVRESNLPARSFYENAGFEQIGSRKSYYQNPLEDAILYRLDLR